MWGFFDISIGYLGIPFLSWTEENFRTVVTEWDGQVSFQSDKSTYPINSLNRDNSSKNKPWVFGLERNSHFWHLTEVVANMAMSPINEKPLVCGSWFTNSSRVLPTSCVANSQCGVLSCPSKMRPHILIFTPKWDNKHLWHFHFYIWNSPPHGSLSVFLSLSCLERCLNTVLSVKCIFSIETELKEKIEE